MSEYTAEQLKKQVSVLEQRLATLENDPGKRGYFALRRIANIQIDQLLKFDIAKELGANPKEDKTYERMNAIAKDLPDTLERLDDLRKKLEVTPKDEEDNAKIVNGSFMDRFAKKNAIVREDI